jgi:hypothetical protein
MITELKKYKKAVHKRISKMKKLFRKAEQQKKKTVKYSTHANKIKKIVEKESYKWCAKNNWFGRDANKTNYAFLVHAKLVDEFNISVNTKSYYNLVDAFMNYYDEVNSIIKLTPMQIKLAKRLGVKYKEYHYER